MTDWIVTLLVGVVCIILGIMNMRGNISSLHAYHRRRVREEDKIPFGKKIGLGTLLCGAAIVGYSVLSMLAQSVEAPAFTVAATVVLIAGTRRRSGVRSLCPLQIQQGYFLNVSFVKEKTREHPDKGYSCVF